MKLNSSLYIKILFVKVCIGTSITLEFSSETKRAVVYEDVNMLINNSFERTSNFLTSSPCTFISPTVPNLKKSYKMISFAYNYY